MSAGALVTGASSGIGAATALQRLGSAPELIARTTVRAATARRPRTRYVVGAGAGPPHPARPHLRPARRQAARLTGPA